MTKHNYLDQIAHKIDAHRQTIEALQREIDKLEGAAEVITQLRGNDGGATLTLEAQPDKKVSPAFTIRKIDPEKKTRQKKQQLSINELGELAKTALAEKPGITGTEIARYLGFDDEPGQKRVWYAVKRLFDNGQLRRDGQNYHLPTE